MHKTLINNIPDRLKALRNQWKITTGDLDNVDWEAALMHPREVAIKLRLRLIQFKILHRVYFDRARLHKIGRAEAPDCLCCRAGRGTYIHTL